MGAGAKSFGSFITPAPTLLCRFAHQRTSPTRAFPELTGFKPQRGSLAVSARFGPRPKRTSSWEKVANDPIQA